MLALLSPAKKLDFAPDALPVRTTKPELSKDTDELMQTARSLSSADLQKLMGLSKALGDLNHERFQSFDLAKQKPPEQRAAAFAFRGDT